MCGITGFSGTKNSDLMKIKFLMYMNSIERGKDATGVYTPKSGIIKDNVKAEVFINNKNHTNKIINDHVLIGHVRAKTVGANLVANAHPFQYGSIVGCHNGTLHNHLDLFWDNQLSNIKDYDVDSQVLISCINENFKNNDGDLKILSEYEGAAALLFYNEETKILHAWHDKERPLFYGYLNATEMYISSIRDSLVAIDCQDIKMFEINTLYRIQEGKILDKKVYKPFAANNDGRIATLLDFTIDKKNSNKIRLKHKNTTGFTWAAVRPVYLVGFWVQYDSYTKNYVTWEKGVRTGGRFFKDAFYKITGYENETTVLVEDEDGEVTREYLTSFKYINFIPTIGRYVVLMRDVHFTESKKLAGKQGEKFLVTRYVYGGDRIWMKNIHGQEIIVSAEDVRIATDAEVKEVTQGKKEEKKEEKQEENKPTCQALIDFNNDLPFSVDENSVNPFDVKEGVKKPDVKNIEPTDDDDDSPREDYAEDYIPYADYATILQRLHVKLEKIKDNYDAMQDISVQLNELESDMLNSYDMSYVLNVVQEDQD